MAGLAAGAVSHLHRVGTPVCPAPACALTPVIGANGGVAGMAAVGERPTAPIFDADETKDLHVFYHNVAYKTSRVAINIEKMKILKDRLGECVRQEGVNYIEKCEQLTKRYEAAVRVCQWNSGSHSRPRNVGNILEKEKQIQEQLRQEGALAA